EDLPSWYLSIASETPEQIQFIIGLGPEDGRYPAITFHLTGTLIGLGFLRFDAVDAWFEEEEQIFVHPRDPYKRIDVLQSSRHVRIEVNGVEIANTRCPLLLFETGEPMRIYIPRTHTRMDLWFPSEHKVACPYKGTATFYNISLSSGEKFENIMWSYPNTTFECTHIKGMVAFLDEKVDVWLDGEQQERPSITIRCTFDTYEYDNMFHSIRWLHNRHPVYAFTREDLPSWYLSIASETPNEIQFIIKLGPERERFPAITFHLTGSLIGLGFIKFDAVDAWFEEEEQIYVHPRDPYKRIDVLQSSRHVRIEINGVEIANTRCPLLLFETGEPMRIYIPRTHTRMDLWHPSQHKVTSPYKGTADYYNVILSSGEIFENIMWSYPIATIECATVKGMLAFFDERVDVWLDGEKQDRPVEAGGNASPSQATPGPSQQGSKPVNDLLVLQKP
ncbi:hypothetical protein CVT25_003684, partial [Psilocybe cyanescens]